MDRRELIRCFKKMHWTGKESLEVKCLRDGSLDCDADTGEVFSVKPDGSRTKRRLHVDRDGYLLFYLNRERRRGKPDRSGRRRARRGVLVHRLVKIKAIAVAKGGDNWRKYVCDLPRGVDVNHIVCPDLAAQIEELRGLPSLTTAQSELLVRLVYRARQDNRASKLELATERANRSKTEMTDEEFAALKAEGW